ncbi:helix-turn-helix transcriptional regulator [Lentzea sp. BCCO 10_0856]|uniref:Helix-turn-helix transcriptional regulator n=1 Tax=Lentzea miocenica TaxID=3095431 RepID=A0ABU4SS14_9PSEU|nr:helix-turn-helix transcriptional regulator [Lentzea sp. BCCO 10_0856]MDX8028679.1 helix-turn-helix transcriptional regulator [Lentzea sp. BCCO 10_0856]
MPKRFSTVRGREFGDGLRAAIAATGMTARRVAELADWQEAKLSDLVNGKGGATELELAVLLGICRTPSAEREHLLTLFRATNVKGWLQEHGAAEPILPRTLVQHEATAKTLVSWQPLVVHGMLQVPDYTRAVLGANPNVPQDEVEERVEARAARKEALRPGLKATFYLHESVLRTPVGGEEVMRAQLRHLEQVSKRPYVVVRVVPTSMGAHAGHSGPFCLLRFHKVEPVVFVESENASLIIEAPLPLKSYDAVVESLARTALDEEQSRSLIKDIAG